MNMIEIHKRPASEIWGYSFDGGMTDRGRTYPNLAPETGRRSYKNSAGVGCGSARIRRKTRSRSREYDVHDCSDAFMSSCAFIIVLTTIRLLIMITGRKAGGSLYQGGH